MNAGLVKEISLPQYKGYLDRSSFQTVLPFWEKFLWKNRRSPIHSVSSMCFLGGNNIEFHQTAQPVFWVIKTFQGEIVGVNSGHSTGTSFRSRGIWIHPQFRKRGLSRLLFMEVLDEAKKRSSEFVWSMPRKSALGAYSSFGFTQASDFFDNSTVEFGPNCYVHLPMSSYDECAAR